MCRRQTATGWRKTEELASASPPSKKAEQKTIAIYPEEEEVVYLPNKQHSVNTKKQLKQAHVQSATQNSNEQ